MAGLIIIKVTIIIKPVIIKAITNSKILDYQKDFQLNFSKKDHYLITIQPIMSSS